MKESFSFSWSFLYYFNQIFHHDVNYIRTIDSVTSRLRFLFIFFFFHLFHSLFFSNVTKVITHVSRRKNNFSKGKFSFFFYFLHQVKSICWIVKKNKSKMNLSFSLDIFWHRRVTVHIIPVANFIVASNHFIWKLVT